MNEQTSKKSAHKRKYAVVLSSELPLLDFSSTFISYNGKNILTQTKIGQKLEFI
jgi:hypothetical protein